MLNKLKEALSKNEVTFGTWMQINSPVSAEILCSAGFDWVCVDLEHGIFDLESLANIFRTIDSFGVVPVARVPFNDVVWIHRTLDAGAKGLIIPMISSREEAKKAISYSRYPPRGTRGVGYCRANAYGDIKKIAKDDDISVILQIEQEKAIDDICGILPVEHFDGTFIGPLDLALSMGVDTDNYKFGCCLDIYLHSCNRFKKPPGIHIVRPNKDDIEKAVKGGYKMIALGLDNVFMDTEARKNILVAKGVLSERN